MLTVERLTDHLSALADIVLAGTLAECWRHLRGSKAPPPRFAIVGYGKLGGKELGYASDLDLVFLYDASDEEEAEGAQALYSRLAQRVNTWLTSMTAAGKLYETDLRLRPDGASGLLVSRLRAFREYERTHAWTWEHQALTRARFVAGDAAIGAAFEAEREAILSQPRDRPRLRAAVIDMRRRMHAGHPNRSALFDLKHDPGGMVDVEFAVQYPGARAVAHCGSSSRTTRKRATSRSSPQRVSACCQANWRSLPRMPTVSTEDCSIGCGCRAQRRRGSIRSRWRSNAPPCRHFGARCVNAVSGESVKFFFFQGGE